jgi:exonuclease III
VLMKLKILSWNVRGINELDKRLRIKELIRDWKVDLVCLMETKMEVISREVV